MSILLQLFLLFLCHDIVKNKNYGFLLISFKVDKPITRPYILFLIIHCQTQNKTHEDESVTKPREGNSGESEDKFTEHFYYWRKFENSSFKGLSLGAFHQFVEITQSKNYKPLSKTLDS